MIYRVMGFDSSKIFYVYRYIRLDNNTPFYVGKGKGRRANSVSAHNMCCKNIFLKYPVKIDFIFKNLTEEEAFEKEREFIELYKKFGYCEANYTIGGGGVVGFKWTKEMKINAAKRMMGNKYSLGFVPSEETRKKRSKSLKGNQNRKGKFPSEATRKKLSIARMGNQNAKGHKMPESNKLRLIELNKGKKRTNKDRQKMSDNHTGRREVIDLASGFIFRSAKEAAASKGISYKRLNNQLLGKRNHKTFLRYLDTVIIEGNNL